MADHPDDGLADRFLAFVRRLTSKPVVHVLRRGRKKIQSPNTKYFRLRWMFRLFRGSGRGVGRGRGGGWIWRAGAAGLLGGASRAGLLLGAGGGGLPALFVVFVIVELGACKNNRELARTTSLLSWSLQEQQGRIVFFAAPASEGEGERRHDGEI